MQDDIIMSILVKGSITPHLELDHAGIEKLLRNTGINGRRFMQGGLVTIDFLERLTEKINLELNLPLRLTMGYLQAEDSLVIYSLPGGRTIEEYFDGTKTKQLNYEIAMKHRSSQMIEATLWELQSFIDDITDVPSEHYQFNGMEITNVPFINQFDEQNYFVFLLNIQTELTIFEKGEI